MALKRLGVADSLVLLDSTQVSLKVKTALDSVYSADALMVKKVLMVADSVFIVEALEVGKGDRRTKLFLILGNVAIQLTKST